MSNSRPRSSASIERIVALFASLNAHTDGAEVIDRAERRNLRNDTIKNLDINKMLRHILDCAFALSYVCLEQKKGLAASDGEEVDNNEGVDNTEDEGVSGNGRERISSLNAAKRRVFSFALQQALSGFMEETDQAPRSSHPAVDHLLEAFPSTQEEMSSDDWLPLHWAIAAAHTTGVATNEVGPIDVKLLYMENASRLRKHHSPCQLLYGEKRAGDYISRIRQDINGFTPLHFLCMSRKPELDLLNFFRDRDPEAFDISVANDDLHYYPLHAAAQYCDSAEALQLLIQISPLHITQNIGGEICDFPLGALIRHFRFPEPEPRRSFQDMFDVLFESCKTVVPVVGGGAREIIRHLSSHRDMKCVDKNNETFSSVCL
jgi:hypothetical protein